VLVAELVLSLDWISGDTEHGGASRGEGAGQPGEIDGLPGAARRVGAGVEEQDQLLAGIIRQRDDTATVAGQAEGGSLLTLGQAGRRRRFGGGCRFGRI
jgi:hypothetical protein